MSNIQKISVEKLGELDEKAGLVSWGMGSMIADDGKEKDFMQLQYDNGLRVVLIVTEIWIPPNSMETVYPEKQLQ